MTETEPNQSELDRILNSLLLLRQQFSIFRRGLEADIVDVIGDDFQADASGGARH